MLACLSCWYQVPAGKFVLLRCSAHPPPLRSSCCSPCRTAFAGSCWWCCCFQLWLCSVETTVRLSMLQVGEVVPTATGRAARTGAVLCTAAWTELNCWWRKLQKVKRRGTVRRKAKLRLRLPLLLLHLTARKQKNIRRKKRARVLAAPANLRKCLAHWMRLTKESCKSFGDRLRWQNYGQKCGLQWRQSVGNLTLYQLPLLPRCLAQRGLLRQRHSHQRLAASSQPNLGCTRMVKLSSSSPKPPLGSRSATSSRLFLWQKSKPCSDSFAPMNSYRGAEQTLSGTSFQNWKAVLLETRPFNRTVGKVLGSSSWVDSWCGFFWLCIMKIVVSTGFNGGFLPGFTGPKNTAKLCTFWGGKKETCHISLKQWQVYLSCPLPPVQVWWFSHGFCSLKGDLPRQNVSLEIFWLAQCLWK